MNFTEKCNLIFNVLKCSNAEVARNGGIDPSLISRFRSGSRKPKAESLQFGLFCKSLIIYAQKNEKIEKLQCECGLPGLGNIEDEIIAYLTDKGEITRKSNLKSTHSIPGLFSEKLNVLMNIFNLSNIQLARVLNVDSSLISRFRNGLRTPLKNYPLMERMCNYFYKIALQNEMGQELSNLIGTSSSSFECKDEFIIKLGNWLSDDNGQYNAGMMDRFLEKLENLTLVKTPELPPLNTIVTADILHDHVDEYIGIDGIRRAVIRFLGTVAMSNKPETLKLYSDQNMNWLSEDIGFSKKWAALMYAILLRKTPIKIIHNINRNPDDMLLGIEKWLPLYMSGMVEGFYRRSHSDPWFSHTLFVAPETAAISANIAIGTEQTGVYHYFNTLEKTAYYDNQINYLFEHAKSLIKVFKKNRVNEYLFYTAEFSKTEGMLKRLPTSLSFATIPFGLLELMLRRTDVDKAEIEKILATHTICVKQFEKELMNGYVTEYIVFASDEDLLAGKVVLNLLDTFTERTIYYTREEYSYHIKHLIGLLENDRYNIVPLPESPYTNIQITVKEDVLAMVQKTDNPVTTFWFSHPLMCKALNEYIDVLGLRNIQKISGKKELVKYLAKYLQ